MRSSRSLKSDFLAFLQVVQVAVSEVEKMLDLEMIQDRVSLFAQFTNVIVTVYLV